MAPEVDDVAQRNLLVAVEYLEDAGGAAAVDNGGGCAAAPRRRFEEAWHFPRRQLLPPLAVAAAVVGGAPVRMSVLFSGATGFRNARLHLHRQAGRNTQATAHLVEPGKSRGGKSI